MNIYIFKFKKMQSFGIIYNYLEKLKKKYTKIN